MILGEDSTPRGKGGRGSGNRGKSNPRADLPKYQSQLRLYQQRSQTSHPQRLMGRLTGIDGTKFSTSQIPHQHSEKPILLAELFTCFAAGTGRKLVDFSNQHGERGEPAYHVGAPSE